MGIYHITIIESQNSHVSHITWLWSWSQYVTKKSADGHEDCGRQDA